MTLTYYFTHTVYGESETEEKTDYVFDYEYYPTYADYRKYLNAKTEEEKDKADDMCDEEALENDQQFIDWLTDEKEKEAKREFRNFED